MASVFAVDIPQQRWGKVVRLKLAPGLGVLRHSKEGTAPKFRYLCGAPPLGCWQDETRRVGTWLQTAARATLARHSFSDGRHSKDGLA